MVDDGRVNEPLDTWAYVELMGHRTLVGRVTERAMGSTVFLAIEVVGRDGVISGFQFVNAASVYALTPTTEENCRRLGRARLSLALLPYVPEEPPQNHEDEDGEEEADALAEEEECEGSIFFTPVYESGAAPASEIQAAIVGPRHRDTESAAQ